MSCFIDPVEEERCVRLACQGEPPPREMMAAGNEAQGVLKARGWNKMILDVRRLRSVPTAQQIYEIAHDISGQMPRRARVALVIRPGQIHQAALLEKIVRKNRVFLTYFVDPENAESWFKQAEAPQRIKLPRLNRVEEMILPIEVSFNQ